MSVSTLPRPIPPPPLRMTLIGGGPGVSVLPPTMGGIRVSKEEEEILAGFMDEVLSPAGQNLNLKLKLD